MITVLNPDDSRPEDGVRSDGNLKIWIESAEEDEVLQHHRFTKSASLHVELGPIARSPAKRPVEFEIICVFLSDSVVFLSDSRGGPLQVTKRMLDSRDLFAAQLSRKVDPYSSINIDINVFRKMASAPSAVEILVYVRRTKNERQRDQLYRRVEFVIPAE